MNPVGQQHDQNGIAQRHQTICPKIMPDSLLPDKRTGHSDPAPNAMRQASNFPVREKDQGVKG
jgi:hypothetical protein